MKHILMAIVAVFTLAATSLLAQPPRPTQSPSGAIAGAQAGAVAGAKSRASVVQNYNGGGTTRIESAPDVIAPSLGSGHPCMQNASAGISVIGGGISGGGGKIDYGCMFLRSGQTAAGLYYYAERDGRACRALRMAGDISPTYPCEGDKQPKAARVSASAGKPALSVRCMKSGNRITPHVSAAVNAAYTKAEIQGACR